MNRYGLANNEVNFDQNITYSSSDQETWHAILLDLGLLTVLDTSMYEQLGVKGSETYNKTLILIATSELGLTYHDPDVDPDLYAATMRDIGLKETLNKTTAELGGRGSASYNTSLINVALMTTYGKSRSDMTESEYEEAMINLALSVGTIPNVTNIADLGGRGSDTYNTAMIALGLHTAYPNETIAEGSSRYQDIMIDNALDFLQIGKLIETYGRYTSIYNVTIQNVGVIDLTGQSYPDLATLQQPENRDDYETFLLKVYWNGVRLYRCLHLFLHTHTHTHILVTHRYKQIRPWVVAEFKQTIISITKMNSTLNSSTRNVSCLRCWSAPSLSLSLSLSTHTHTHTHTFTTNKQ
jgi:hypothetical protein